MKHGLFLMPVHPPEKSWEQTYREDMNTIIAADELGYEEAWIGEHFTIKWENIPAPDLFIAKALGLTKNIKLGTGVVLLQLHNPVELAHRIAVLDHLAEGRFYFGIGTGGVPTEFELFDIPEDERHARASEVIDIVLKIWEADGPLDYQGRFHHVKSPKPWPDIDLSLYVKPRTKPYPPIAVAGVSKHSSTIEWAGENDWIPLSIQMLPHDGLDTHWAAYERGAQKAGRTPDRRQWRICQDVYVDETTEQAREDVLASGLGRTYTRYMLPLLQQTFGSLDLFKSDESVPDEAINLEYLIDKHWIVGDPDYCIQRVRGLYDEVGGFGTLLQVMQDWDPAEKGLKSLELFQKHVAPALADL